MRIPSGSGCPWTRTPSLEKLSIHGGVEIRQYGSEEGAGLTQVHKRKRGQVFLFAFKIMKLKGLKCFYIINYQTMKPWPFGLGKYTIQKDLTLYTKGEPIIAERMKRLRWQ